KAAHLDWEMLRRMFLGKYPDFGEPLDATESGMLGPLFHEGAPAARKGRGGKSKAAESAPEKPRSGRGRGKAAKSAEQHQTAQHHAEDQLQREAESVRSQHDQLRNEAEQLAVSRAKMAAEMDGLREQLEAERRQLEVERQRAKEEIERVEARRAEL